MRSVISTSGTTAARGWPYHALFTTFIAAGYVDAVNAFAHGLQMSSTVGSDAADDPELRHFIEMPNATITDVVFRMSVGNSRTHAIDEAHVYTYSVA